MKRKGKRKNRFVFLALILLGVIVGAFALYNQFAGGGKVKGLNEYTQWEYRMLDENPEYDDLKILVDIAEKRLYLLNGNEVIKKYAIASGRAGHPSPLGSWTVVNKGKWGGGFGTRWMGLNVPWGTSHKEHNSITTCQTLKKLRDRLFLFCFLKIGILVIMRRYY